MELVLHIALIGAATAHGARALWRADRRRRARGRTVVVTLTCDTSAFDAAITSVHEDMRRMARGMA